VKEGGAYLNNERVADADAVLRRGRRTIAGVRRGAASDA
jgi:tyrosyl-tRNA synthetase